MELGIVIPSFEIDGGTAAIADELARAATATEAAGAVSLSVIIGPPGGARAAWIDAIAPVVPRLRHLG